MPEPELIWMLLLRHRAVVVMLFGRGTLSSHSFLGLKSVKRSQLIHCNPQQISVPREKKVFLSLRHFVFPALNLGVICQVCTKRTTAQPNGLSFLPVTSSFAVFFFFLNQIMVTWCFRMLHKLERYNRAPVQVFFPLLSPLSTHSNSFIPHKMSGIY